MADFVDAANGLADLVATTLAPDVSGVVTLGSVSATVKIYVGWPNSQTLQSDLAAHVVHISVWPLPIERITSITHTDMDWNEDGGTAISREVERATRQMQIGIWCDDWSVRDTIGKALDAVLANTPRFTLADDTQAQLSRQGGRIVDDRQIANLYRRDLLYAVNYATLETDTAYQIETTITDVTVEVNGATIGHIQLENQG